MRNLRSASPDVLVDVSSDSSRVHRTFLKLTKVIRCQDSMAVWTVDSASSREMPKFSSSRRTHQVTGSSKDRNHGFAFAP
jgi:hypothetical protein